ncbi:PDDEXK family nuclease [Dolichospermum compactum]|uniref:Uncharacterized protein n=1 Tax=Dolichospermum compactum NIES-806 TaxID=1973481 RepID=A0A1Z4V963_9CYAN|nr:hypothetical protein NIES806_40810 [Dolichospermum compactum NIES-806]
MKPGNQGINSPSDIILVEAMKHNLRSPYYVIFDRYENKLRVFQLVGTRYQAVELVEPKFWFPELELGVGVWSGKYQDTEGLWLRWYNQDGDWIPTFAERAEQEKQRADKLAEKLRALGVNLDDI